jgi:Lsr2
MASIVSVVVSDDLDGSEGAETVTFALDGVTYEIDLAERNRAKLAKAMAPYVEAARRVRPRRTRASGSTRSRASGDSGAVRQWAKQQGLKVSERGRISAEVMAQYEAAN